MTRGRRRARWLVVGDVVWRWSVRARVDQRVTVTLWREGTRAPLVFVFRAGGGPGRIVGDACVGSPAEGWLNPHQPGTVRALFDAAAARGWLPGGREAPVVREVDGWALFGEVVRR